MNRLQIERDGVISLDASSADGKAWTFDDRQVDNIQSVLRTGNFLRVDGTALVVRCPPGSERLAARYLKIAPRVTVDSFLLDTEVILSVPPDEQPADLNVKINGKRWILLPQRRIWIPIDLDDRLDRIAWIEFSGSDFNGGSGESLDAWLDLRVYSSPYYETDEQSDTYVKGTAVSAAEARRFFRSAVLLDDVFGIQNEVDSIEIGSPHLPNKTLAGYLQGKTWITATSTVKIVGNDATKGSSP